MIHDGRSRFDLTQRDFLRVHGVEAPPDDAVDGNAEPALAQVNTLGRLSRWVAACPAVGCGGAEYVWLDAPGFFCASCCNADVGGRWRPLIVPQDRARIEALLLRRRPENRHWLPEESSDDLRAENTAHGVTP